MRKRTPTGALLSIEHGSCGTSPSNATTPERKELVIRHIKSFPAVESHYCRRKSRKLYLACDVSSINKMYELYCQWITTQRNCENEPPVSKSVYRKIFHELEPPISFFQPKKDQCGKCNLYKEADREEKEKLQDSYDAHREREKAALTAKRNDFKNADNIHSITIAFDLQGT